MDAILEAAKGLDVQILRPGEILVTEGQRTGRLFILKSGMLEVVREGSSVAGIAEPGSVIGELSALTDDAHSATVRSRDGAEVYIVDHPDQFLDAHPTVARHIARVLAQRLLKTTAILVDMRRRAKEREDKDLFEKIFELIK